MYSIFNHNQREHEFQHWTNGHLKYSTVGWWVNTIDDECFVYRTGESKCHNSRAHLARSQKRYICVTSSDDILVCCFLNVMPSEVNGSENCCILLPRPTFDGCSQLESSIGTFLRNLFKFNFTLTYIMGWKGCLAQEMIPHPHGYFLNICYYYRVQWLRAYKWWYV